MEKKFMKAYAHLRKMAKANNEDKYFRIPADLRNINYDIHQNKNKISKSSSPYSSDNTYRLDVHEIIKLLKNTQNNFI